MYRTSTATPQHQQSTALGHFKVIGKVSYTLISQLGASTVLEYLRSRWFLAHHDPIIYSFPFRTLIIVLSKQHWGHPTKRCYSHIPPPFDSFNAYSRTITRYIRVVYLLPSLRCLCGAYALRKPPEILGFPKPEAVPGSPDTFATRKCFDLLPFLP